MAVDDPENFWAEVVGECYTSDGMQQVLGITRSALSRASRDRRVLRLTTGDGTSVFPTFQLRDGRVIPGLREVLLQLATGETDPWSWALWLNGVARDEHGQPLPRNVERLAAGEVADVLREAQRDAWTWST